MDIQRTDNENRIYNDLTIDVIRYLKDIISEKPPKTVSDADILVHFNEDYEDYPGVSFFPTEDVWFRISRLSPTSPPEPNPFVGMWLDFSSKKEKPHALYEINLDEDKIGYYNEYFETLGFSEDWKQKKAICKKWLEFDFTIRKSLIFALHNKQNDNFQPLIAQSPKKGRVRH